MVDLHQDLIRAQRGYVLTSDVTFLDEYEAALGRVNRVTAQLANDLRGQEGFEQTAERLANLGQAKLGQIQAALRLHQAEQTSAAVDLIDSRESRRLTAEIRNEILRIDQVAEERLQRALVAAERASLSTRNLALATQLILLLAILASGLSINRLIDNQRRAGQRYRDLSVRQEAIFQNALDALLIHTPDGVIESVNPAASRLYGYGPDEFIGQSIGILFKTPPTKEAIERTLSNIAEEPVGAPAVMREFIGCRKDRTPVTVEVSTSPIRLEDGLHFLAGIRDVTERKKVERMKTEFVSTVSHELRTPLTSIAGSLGLLAGGATGALPDRANKLVHIAHSNSTRLVRLINDILDIEKMESGKMPFDIKPIPLRATVEHVALSNKAYADEYGVDVQILAGGENSVVQADPDRLIQVITNLLSNAIKFSPSGTAVTIALSSSGNFHRMSITDQGPGIAKEFRGELFTKFAQADSSATRQRGGTGLGLSIVKEIVDHLGGSISVVTEVGEGTTFHIDLPRKKTSVAGLDAAPQADQDDVSLRILHVDDDLDILSVTESAFAGRAIVRPATSLHSARAALASETFDLVVLDLGLPDGPGLELLPELRNGVDEPVPVIIFSARDCEPGLGRLVDAVLTKSRTNLDDLVNTAERVLGERSEVHDEQE